MTPAERTRRWQQANREAYLAYRRAHYALNRDRILAAQQARRAQQKAANP